MYKEKYLKYKNKYISLQKTLGGVQREEFPPNLEWNNNSCFGDVILLLIYFATGIRNNLFNKIDSIDNDDIKNIITDLQSMAFNTKKNISEHKNKIKTNCLVEGTYWNLLNQKYGTKQSAIELLEKIFTIAKVPEYAYTIIFMIYPSNLYTRLNSYKLQPVTRYKTDEILYYVDNCINKKYIFINNTNKDIDIIQNIIRINNYFIYKIVSCIILKDNHYIYYLYNNRQWIVYNDMKPDINIIDTQDIKNIEYNEILLCYVNITYY